MGRGNAFRAAARFIASKTLCRRKAHRLQRIQRAVCEAIEPRLLFSTWTVMSSADSGSTTLRGIIASHVNGATGDQTIQFDSSVTSIALTTGVLEINDTTGTVTIDGPGASALTIKTATAHTGGVFKIDSGSTVLIGGVTISNGSAAAGAGIMNAGDLTVQNSIITGNTASAVGGGVYNDGGTLTLDGTAVSYNSAAIGGGVASCNGDVTIEGGSVIAHNTAGEGGGIYTGGSTTTNVNQSSVEDNSASGEGGGIDARGSSETTLVNLNESTVTGNTATSDGAGIYDYAYLTARASTISYNHANSGSYGGAVYGNGADMTLVNCTVTGNTATSGGALYADFAGPYVVDSTISGNSATGYGAGVSTNTGGDIEGSIVSGNTGGAADLSNLYGGFYGTISGRNDLVGTYAPYNYASTGGLNPASINPSNFVGVTTPGLLSLANNGGPTETMAFNTTSGSDAIGNGGAFNDPTIPGYSTDVHTDQRGDFRPTTDHIDIGAFQSFVASATYSSGTAVPLSYLPSAGSSVTYTWSVVSKPSTAIAVYMYMARTA